MKTTFAILALADLVLMSAAAVAGLLVAGGDGFALHFLLGLLTALFTCLVHVIAFMYFVVCENIVRQAARTGPAGPREFESVRALKRRALRASMIGIVSIVSTAGLGAAVGIHVSPHVHMLAAFVAIVLNGAAFCYQFTLIDRNTREFNAVFSQE